MRRIFAACIMLTLPLVCLAQTPKTCAQFQASGEYHSARAQGKTEKEAQDNARALLVQQLSSLVTSRTDMTINAGNESSEQQFFNLSRTVSNLRLDGLKYMTCNDEDAKKKKKGDGGDEISVVCYISKQDLSKSAEEVRKTVTDYLQLYTQKQDLGLDGLSDLYIAYLNSYLTPLAIQYNFGMDTVQNVRPYLETRLRSHLAEIELACAKVEEHPQYPEEQLRLTLKVKGESATGLTYTLACTALNASTEIAEGTSKFDILMQPSTTSENFSGSLTLGAVALPEALKNIQEAVAVSKEITFTADMSSIISIDFSILDKGDYWELVPETRHLSISAFEWSTNGKRLSTEQLPKVPKEEMGSEITLKLNRNEKLSVSKPIKASEAMVKRYSQQVEITKTPEPKATEVATSEMKTNTSTHSEDAYGIAPLTDFTSVQAKLKELKDKGKAIYGKKSNFLKPDNCRVLLIDPQTKSLQHVLEAQTPSGRKDLKTGQTYADFENQLKGFIAIWVELY